MEPVFRVNQVVYAALLCAFLSIVSMLYIDRPVLQFALYLRHWRYFDVLASPSLLSLPGACLFLAFYAVRRLSGRPPSAHMQLFLSLSIAIAIGTLAKDELKWLFGRPWPLTYIRHGIYTFHPFQNDFYYGGFPSGHTTYAAAPMFILWWRVPQLRWLWLSIVLMVMIGLIGSYHHFVADTIAGFFLGLAAAAGTVAFGPKVPVFKLVGLRLHNGAMQPQPELNLQTRQRL